MGSFLSQWVDGTMDVNEEWDPDETLRSILHTYEEIRLMASYAVDIPRRLGGEASSDELRTDRKFSKRVMSVYRSLITAALKGKEGDFDISEERAEELRIMGAQVDWHEWHSERITTAQNALVQIATHAVKLGKIKPGNSICNTIQNEIAQMDQAYDRIFGE